MKILVVEDEAHLADGLRFNLEAEGYDVVLAADGEKAVEALETHSFDCAVLDVMLPGISGFDVAKHARGRGDHTPILMLTALSRPQDVLEGFDAGADDYLAKPFDLSIFLARINGLIRRRGWIEAGRERETAERGPQTINGRTIDLENLELIADGEVTQLTLMEAKLLKYLIENAGRAVSRMEILSAVWDLAVDTDTRAIDNFIVRLRRLLGDDSSRPQILQTVRGVGYRLNLSSE